MLLRSLVLTLLIAAGGPQRAEPDNDSVARFPSLMTTLVAPQADHGPLTECAVLDGKRRCADDLADAWCVKNGFTGYEDVRIDVAPDTPACRKDERSCKVIRTITCRRPAIVD